MRLDQREQRIKKVLVITLMLNLLVGLTKISIGHFSGFISLLTSGIDSLFDSSSNVLALVAIRVAYRPADEGHHYGHQKYENLGALLLSAVLIYAALQVGFEAWKAIDEGFQAEASFLALGVAAFSAFVNFFVSRYEKHEGEKLSSALLIADAKHTAGDYIISLGVVISIACAYAGWHWVDLAVGALVSFYLVYTAVTIAKENLADLLDASPGFHQKLKTLVTRMPDVLDCHKFRVRGTKAQMYIDFHILVDPKLSLKKAHDISHQAEDLLKNYLKQKVLNVDITVHAEPYESSHED